MHIQALRQHIGWSFAALTSGNNSRAVRAVASCVITLGTVQYLSQRIDEAAVIFG